MHKQLSVVSKLLATRPSKKHQHMVEVVVSSEILDRYNQSTGTRLTTTYLWSNTEGRWYYDDADKSPVIDLNVLAALKTAAQGGPPLSRAVGHSPVVAPNMKLV
jgi:hypothetical protein